MTFLQSVNSKFTFDAPPDEFEIRTRKRPGGASRAEVRSKRTCDLDDPARGTAVVQAKAIRKALHHNNIHAAGTPERTGTGNRQWIQLRNGHAALAVFTPHAKLIVPSAEPAYAETAPKQSVLRKIVKPLTVALPRLWKVEPQQTPAEAKGSDRLAHVPHEAITGQAKDARDNVFQVVNGRLYHFDARRERFEQVLDTSYDPADMGPYTRVSTLADGKAYAMRGNEVVRLDTCGSVAEGDLRVEPMVVFRHENEAAVRDAALAGDTLFVLDEQGHVARQTGNEPHKESLPVVLYDENDKPLPNATAVSISCSEKSNGLIVEAFVAGSDGKLYELRDVEVLGEQRVVKATVVQDTPEGIVDLVQTKEGGAVVLHALLRDEQGAVRSAYFDHDGKFKPGWRFDTALMYTARNGVPQIEVDEASQAVCVNPEGLLLAVHEGQVYAARPGTRDWVPTSLDGLAVDEKPKVNAVGDSKAYVKRDGAVVRLDLVNYDDPLIARGKQPDGKSGEPFLHGVRPPIDVKPKTVLEPDDGEAIKDYAVLETESVFPGTLTKVAYHLDEQDRLFRTDLNDGSKTDVHAQKGEGAERMGEIVQIALNRAGTLYALARGTDGDALSLYRLEPAQTDASPPVPTWVACKRVKLAEGDKLHSIETSFQGQLHVRVAGSDGPLRLPYRYVDNVGLLPAEGYAPRDALRKAGGKDISLGTSLPLVHLKTDILGSKSTRNPFKSDTPRGEPSKIIGENTQEPKSLHPGMIKSLGGHVARLAHVPKQAADYGRHKFQGYENLKGLYDSVTHSAENVKKALEQATDANAPGRFIDIPQRLEELAEEHEGVGTKARKFYDELLTNTHQMLEHIGHSSGFLDMNLSDSPHYKPQKVRWRDLVPDLRNWFREFAKAEGDPPSPQAKKVIDLLERLGGAAKPLRLPYPDEVVAQKRNTSDKQAIATARLLKNVQALQSLAQTLEARTLPATFDEIKSGYDNDPVTVYSKVAMQDFRAVEDAQDIFKTISRGLGNEKHPLAMVVAGGLGVKNGAARKAELLKQVDQALHDAAAATQTPPLDPTLLARYGFGAEEKAKEKAKDEKEDKVEGVVGDLRELRRALTDSTHDKHDSIKRQLDREYRAELKNKFAEAILGMKAKEILVIDRNYGLGLDPLAYVFLGGKSFAFAGGMVGTDYNFYVEVLGDNPRTGDLAFVLDKQRSKVFEVSAGVGHTAGHGPGFLDHWFRAAAFLEIGVNKGGGGGPLFVVPRDKIQQLVDKVFEFGEQKDGGDVPALLHDTLEREMASHDMFSIEAKLQVFARAGASAYHQNSGGAFWAARPSLAQIAMGIKYEWEEYKFRGTTLEGAIQPGYEEHSYIATEFALGILSLRFRHWFNFPTAEEAAHQAAIGFGNTDNEWQAAIHDKSGHKNECRLGVPATVSTKEWADTLQVFERALGDLDHVKSLLPDKYGEIEKWATDEANRIAEHGKHVEGKPVAEQDEVGLDKDSTFVDRLKALRDSVDQWRCDDVEKAAAVEAIDMLRWQHGLALSGRPQIMGIIDEIRLTNPSDLLKVSVLRKLGEATILPRPDEETDVLRRLHRQVQMDPALMRIVKGLINAHATRIKVKCEPKPEALDDLVRKQMQNPRMAMSEQQLKEWIADPKNMRIKTITALRGNEVNTSASIFPVVGVASGASVLHEENVGDVYFAYRRGDSSHPVRYIVGGGHNASLELTRRAFEVPQGTHEDHKKMSMRPVVMPYGAAPAATPGGDDKNKGKAELEPITAKIEEIFDTEGPSGPIEPGDESEVAHHA